MRKVDQQSLMAEYSTTRFLQNPSISLIKSTLSCFKIKAVSSVFETRLDDIAEKTSDRREFMKRPVRYAFNIVGTLKKEAFYTQQTICLIFDNKETATQMQKKCIGKYIDDKLEKYKIRLKINGKLSLQEIEKCEEIQNLLPED